MNIDTLDEHTMNRGLNRAELPASPREKGSSRVDCRRRRTAQVPIHLRGEFSPLIRQAWRFAWYFRSWQAPRCCGSFPRGLLCWWG
jgi:hypothetical protein